MKKEKAESQNFILNKFRQGNLRVTPQRIIIFNALLNDKSHPTADAVFKRVKKKIPNISFDTVNRTLLLFVRLGLLRLVEGYGPFRRFDTDISDHHHFHCSKCNRIVDFYCSGFNYPEIPNQIKNRFTITGKRVVLEGLCDLCKK